MANFSPLVLLLSVFLCVAVASHQPLCTRGPYRSIEGDCNNVFHPTWGQAGQPFSHLEGEAPVFANLPNERVVSNKAFAYPFFKHESEYTFAERVRGLKPDPLGRNHLFVALAQMTSHDLGHNPLLFNFANFSENYAVKLTEPNDPLYEPDSAFNKTGLFTIKSFGVTNNGIFHSFNNASSFLDAAPIYGHRASTTQNLRLFSGGKMKTHNNLGLDLPKQNATGFAVPNECGSFGHVNNAAGDLRVDENVVLTSLHTIWLKEHNYWANQYAASHPGADDEEIFQEARKKVIAIWQNIVFYEVMPTLLGDRVWNRLGGYPGYEDDVDPTVSISFSTVAFRVVHDLVPQPVLILNNNCEGTLPPLTDGRPTQERGNCIADVFAANGLDNVVRGALNQWAQAQDGRVVDGLRNVFLKANTRGGNLDVEVSNIFRGREHRAPTFNALRKFYTGKSLYQERGCNEGVNEDSLRCFELITNNRTLAAQLKDLYKKVAYVDAYVGMLAESTRHPYIYPEVASRVVLSQFDKVRSADWWWFENRDNEMFTSREIRQIRDITFAQVLNRHTNVEVGEDAFSVRNDCPLL